MSEAKPAKVVYVAKFRLSTGQDLTRRKERGPRVEILTFRLKRETRKKILATRMKFRHQLFKHALSFYGLQVIRPTDAKFAEEIAGEASEALQKIDKRLSARLVLIPLAIDRKNYSEVYDAMVGTIKERLFTELVDRVAKLAAKGETVPEGSRKAMLKLCDRLKSWNVVDDPEVNKTIDGYARLLDRNALAPLQKSLRSELDALSHEGLYLEL